MAATITVLAGALLLAAPSANAARPIRTEEPPGEFFIPAGEGCPDFGVHGEGIHHTRIVHTQFSDGREVTNTSATIALTNVETHQTVEQLSRYMSVTTVDPDAGDLLVEIHGRFFVAFWPGDIGPDGSTIVTESMLLSVVGHQTFTLDAETGAFVDYELDGQVVFDVCAALSG
ncbi:MAG: hypothetical protein ACRDO2_10020 [Nocardioidaceae bacterium]